MMTTTTTEIRTVLLTAETPTIWEEVGQPSPSLVLLCLLLCDVSSTDPQMTTEQKPKTITFQHGRFNTDRKNVIGRETRYE